MINKGRGECMIISIIQGAHQKVYPAGVLFMDELPLAKRIQRQLLTVEKKQCLPVRRGLM